MDIIHRTSEMNAIYMPAHMLIAEQYIKVGAYSRVTEPELIMGSVCGVWFCLRGMYNNVDVKNT